MFTAGFIYLNMKNYVKHLFSTRMIIFTSLFVLLSMPFSFAQELSFDALKERANTRSVARSNTGTSTHLVKNGETLFSVSRRYNMTVTELKQLNGLRSNLIKSGQRLTVVPAQNTRSLNNSTSTRAIQRGVTAGASRSLNSLAARDQIDVELDILATSRANYPPPIQSSSARLAPRVSARTIAKTAMLNVEKKQYYQVKRGDDIYSIADTYEVGVNELRAWNMLDHVEDGQVIVVRKWYEEVDPSTANEFDAANPPSSQSRTINTRAVSSPREAASLRVKRAEKRQNPMSIPPTATKSANKANSRSLPQASRSDIYRTGQWANDTESDTGPYIPYKNANINDLRFYAVHPYLPIGSTIKMQLPDNPGYIELIVVGKLNNERTNAIIGLSPACIEILRGAKSQSVTIRY